MPVKNGTAKKKSPVDPAEEGAQNLYDLLKAYEKGFPWGQTIPEDFFSSKEKMKGLAKQRLGKDIVVGFKKKYKVSAHSGGSPVTDMTSRKDKAKILLYRGLHGDNPQMEGLKEFFSVNEDFLDLKNVAYCWQELDNPPDGLALERTLWIGFTKNISLAMVSKFCEGVENAVDCNNGYGYVVFRNKASAENALKKAEEKAELPFRLTKPNVWHTVYVGYVGSGESTSLVIRSKAHLDNLFYPATDDFYSALSVRLRLANNLDFFRILLLPSSDSLPRCEFEWINALGTAQMGLQYLNKAKTIELDILTEENSILAVGEYSDRAKKRIEDDMRYWCKKQERKLRAYIAAVGP